MYKLISQLLENGISLSRTGEKLNIEFNSDTIPDDLLQRIKENKQELLEYLGREDTKGDYKDITPVNATGPFELSSAQRRLWILSQLEGGSTAYNLPVSTILTRDIEIESFKQALSATIDRHEILRTVFREDESGEVRQWVLKREELGFEIDYQDFRKEPNKRERAKAYITQDTYRSFDLESGPLLRAALLRLEEKEYVFYFNMHHIISDGWSMEVLSKDVFSYYEAYEAGTTPQMQELRIQYKDYSAWQLAQLNEDAFKAHQAYWLDKLSGELPLLDLPTTKQRPKVKTYNGHSFVTHLDKATTNKLKSYVQEHGGSLFMGILACWKVLMHRYTAQTDIIIGTPIAGRDHADLEDQIGFYVNMLPLRNEVEPEASFDHFYQSLKEDTFRSYGHQMYPFDRLVEDLDLQRDISRSPVFDISLTYHETIENDGLELLDDHAINQVSDDGPSKVKSDIELHFGERGDHIYFRLIYNEEVYERAMIVRLMEHFKGLSISILSHPGQKISQIDYLSTREKQELLAPLNEMAVDYPREETIVSLFEKQAEKTPDHVALVFAKKELTYRQLNEQANQLAHYLIEQGVQQEMLVPICLERGVEMLIGILGILKAGGCYVPIDPEYPQERISHMLADTDAQIVVTTRASEASLKGAYANKLVVIDQEGSSISQRPVTSPAIKVMPDHLAYVIYTSGSTGRSKGVLIQHNNVVRLFFNDASLYDFSDGDTWTLFHSFCFDFSVWEMCGALFYGGRLVIIPKWVTKDVDAFRDLLLEEQVTVLNQTPSAFYSLQKSTEVEDRSLQIRYVIFGGEALNPSKIKPWKKRYPDCALVNMYGITETTVHVTYQELGLEHMNDSSSVIGRAIPTLAIFILDDAGQLVADGLSGEICIGGAGLARGYLNQPVLTAEKFIDSPFEEGARLYRSGDLGRWLPDGNLEYLGRKDDQVKIRGHRIELGEVLYALEQHEEIDNAVVLSRTNGSGDQELVAYITSGTKQNASNLRSYLSGVLPAYMLPAYYVQLESVPLTTNGKVDKKALPYPEDLGLGSGVEYVAPRDDIEASMVSIWSEILRVDEDKLGIKDSFFELGGDSIKIIRLLVAVRKEMHYQFSVNEVYNHDTIEELIQYAKKSKTAIDSKNEWLAEKEKSIRSEIEQLKEKILSTDTALYKENIEDIYPMSDIEKGMVFGYWMNEGTGTYHDQMVHSQVYRNFDIARFNLALNLLSKKHDILRTSFHLTEFEREVQIIHQTIESNIELNDLSTLTQKEQEEEIKRYMLTALDSIDISKAPLWDVSVFYVGEDNYIFLFQFHHAIIDGWSMASFLMELNNLYLKLEEDINHKPSLLKSSYKEAVIQNELNKTDDALKDYWKSELSGYERLDLLTDQEELASYSYKYDSNYLEKIEHVAKTLNTTVKVVSFSAYLYMLKILSNSSEIVTGLVTNTRPNTEDGDKILGCFLNTVPLKFEVDVDLPCADFITTVNKKLIALKNHEKLSLLEISSIVEGAKESHASNPFFDILFNYIDFHIYQDLVEVQSKEDSSTSEASSFDISGHVRTNTFFDFTISATGGHYDVIIKATKKLNADLSLAYVGGLYSKILDFILENQSTQLKNIDYLSEAEKHQLLFTLNDTAVAYPRDKTMVGLFEEQAIKSPEQVALVFEDTELTYRALNEQSNQLAHYLRDQYDIQPDNLVGIKQERSEWMIVSILGVLKSGGAYVPIDPDYPQERIDYLEKDINCKVCLDEKELRAFKSSQERYSKEPIIPTAKEDDLAYVIYTSGSTGKPKGVMVEHRSFLNLVVDQINTFGITSDDKVLQFASISFDASVLEIFMALSTGAQLVLIKDQHIHQGNDLLTYLNQKQVSVMAVTAPLLETLAVRQLANIRVIITGGQSLSVEKAIECASIAAYYNEYGPTENTVCTSIYQVDRTDVKRLSIPIGKPIANTQVYLVDSSLNLVAPGLVGEICISGMGLARGYLNEEKLTKEKFIANPFKEGERLYRTGDLGRWLPDGNIEFIGRKDDQVKIRGYRIELGEIAHALEQNKEITQAIAVARENASGEKELVAYFTSDVEQKVDELRAYLGETLPSYMLPTYFVQLKTMPLTSNGKVDKKSLPDPEDLGLTSGVEYVAPGNETEEQLVKIWEEVLDRENIGVNDDFFALGGHSLKAVRLSNEYQKELAVKLRLKDLFAHTSIASQAALIASSARETFVQIERTTPQASYALSDGQRRLWVLSQFEGGSTAYNMPGSLKLNQAIEIENFQRAIDATIDRHEVLRTVFREDDSGEVRQWILEREELGFVIDYQDFRQVPNKRERIEEYIAAETFRLFDLERGPLLRAALLQLSEDEYVFYYNMHHIISDGWSLEVLSKDVFSYYEAYEAGTTPQMQALRIQYKDYSAWQLAQLNEKSFEAHQSYWLDRLKGELPLLDLPTTKQRPLVKTYNGLGLSTYLDKVTTAKLKGYIEEHGGSLFMGILASWNVLMYRYTAQEDIIMGTPVAGRDHADLEDQIGFYVNTLALRNEVKGESSFDSFYQDLKEETFKSYNHQMYPFDRLVEDLDLQRDTSRSAVFDVMLILENGEEMTKGIELSEKELTQIVDQGAGTSKFDLEFTVQEIGGYLSMRFVYNTDVYEREMVEGLIRHYKQLLQALLGTPEEKISQIDYLSDEEKHQLLVTNNDNAVVYPKDKTIVDLFEAQVAKTPDQVAVVFEDTELTYRELDARSNQLAHYLRDQYDIQPDDLVGIKQERSEWMLISILGVLKSGGAYVPIDPEYPQERIDYIERDTNCKVCLDESELNKFRESEAAYPDEPIRSSTTSSHLLYVIYTSGSTGQPKGVMVEHRSLVNRLLWMKRELMVEESDVFLQKTPVTFDVSVWELFLPLLSGSKLVFARADGHKDPQYLDELIARQKVSIIHFVPSMLSAALDTIQWKKLEHLRHVVCSGEALSKSIESSFREKAPLTSLHNYYGPTEASIDVTAIDLSQHPTLGSEVAIGKPVDNTSIYITDDKNGLQPIGVIGELLIGGDQVARGYLNREELTREKFVATSPFKEGERLYKTGDLARWLPDGNIEFIGRKDDQVKIRGHRIELGEIENVLNGHDSIENFAVLAKESKDGEKNIISYIVPSKKKAFTVHQLLNTNGHDLEFDAELYEMDNGVSMYAFNRSEVKMLYTEIFDSKTYYKNGIVIPKGACILDVGANVGAFSIFSLLTFEDPTVYAFEPVAPIYGLLEKNMGLYQGNVKVFNVGISNKEEEAVFDYYPYATVLSGRYAESNDVKDSVRRFTDNTQKTDETITDAQVEELLKDRLIKQEYSCQLMTLSQVIKENDISHIDLLKIDVENAEMDVIEGIVEEDWAKIDQIIIEVHDDNDRLKKVKQLLNSHGFKVSAYQSEELKGTKLYDVYCIREKQIIEGKVEESLKDQWHGTNALIESVRQRFSEKLPDYMVPAEIIALDHIPVTPNGKLDRKALLEIDASSLTNKQDFLLPRNETEEQLVKIWEEVLQKDKIGVNDDFFALGGHSLKAVRLSNEYQKVFEVKLTFRELFTHSHIASHAELISTTTKSTFVQIEKVAPQASYVLSDGQRRLWVLSQFEGGSTAYNMPGSLTLNREIEIENFKRAIGATIDRHEILRTVFREDESGEVRQWILEREEIEFEIDYQDFRKESHKQRKAEAYIASDAFRPFDLEHGPLLRAALLQLGEKEYVFYYNMHHTISDGWSMEVLSKDVFSYYEAYQSGTTPEIQELRIQYKDYSSWQLAQLNEESFKVHQSYWLDRLTGELPLLNLPTTKQRPSVKTYNGRGLSTYLDKAITAKLKDYIQEHGGSLFMGLLASWNVLMYRYTAQEDIIIGTPAADRDHADLEDQIGFYVNTLALRNEVKGNSSFNRFYQTLKEETFKSYSHQMYPFDRLVEDLDLQRDTSRSAVFDVMLILQNTVEMTEGVAPSEEELTQIVDRGISTSKFDLEVTIQEIEGFLSLNFVYNTDVYEQVMVEGLIRHYKQLLKALLDTPEEKISQIDYLSDQEKYELLVTNNDTAVAYPKDKTIVDLFEAQVTDTPDQVAVVFEDTELTYRELDERSNQLAHYLRDQYDIQPDDLVGIKLVRSEWMIVSILGVLKSGGAYVPIDPEYPQERIAYIEKDTQCKVILNEIELSKFKASEAEYSKESVSSDVGEDHLAYVIYTSGSTGDPKGVMINHGNLYGSICNRNAYYDHAASYLMIPSFSFDSSVAVLWGSLTGGSTLYLASDSDLKDVASITGFVQTHDIASILCVPSYYQLLLSHSSTTKLPFDRVILAGDTLTNGLIKKHFQLLPDCSLYNEYGPTENTVWSSVANIKQEIREVHIGKPIGNTQIYIVDTGKNLVPSGVAGEILLGGVQVARGYLNQDELTQKKFIRSPFKEGERLYKTGDLGRWLPDGSIEFIGRKDDQVKIRGYRIELGEIGHALEQNNAIREAVVLARENESGEKELVAYITADEEQNSNDLRSDLRQTLPAYMLPAYYVQLDVFPLTANGKIDKKSLPDPEGLALTSGVDYVAPVTDQEKDLTSVWSDVLKREKIGLKDNFFNLGGDSIKSIQVVARLKQLGYTLKVEHLLRTPVLEELASLMEYTTQVADQQEVSGPVVLTPIQEWFFKAEAIKKPDHFNQSVLLYSKEALDGKIMEKSLEELSRHHDALRMVYQQREGSWEQVNQDTSSKRYTIDFHDLRATADGPGQIAKIGEELQSSIKLSEGPLLRAVHFRLADGDRLGLIIHHLVVDGVSWRILLEDLSTLYTGNKKGKKPELPLKTDSFQRWAQLQKEYAASEELVTERAYWQEICDQQIAGLPCDKDVKAGQAVDIDAAESFSLSEKTTGLLQTRVHGVYNTEINDVLLTGLGLALQEVLGVDQSVLKMEGHGREEIIEGVDISRTVGWFTTTYPHVLDVSGASSQTESLVSIKESLRRLPNKGIGYGMLAYLNGAGFESKITPEIIFNYLGDFGGSASNDEGSLFEYAAEYLGPEISAQNGTDAILDVSGMLVKGSLNMSIRYSSSKYDASTIKKLTSSYEKHLESLIKTLSKSEVKYLTPSDLSFKGLSREELSELNSDNTLEDVYELSPLQEGIYYHWLAQGSSSLYFEQTSYKVRAQALDIEKLKGAYDQLVARHAVLRTSFSTEYAGMSLQIVRKDVPDNFTYKQLGNQTDSKLQIALLKEQDKDKGFDLSSGSQMRLQVIDLSEGEYEFIWSHHHVLMDGWCISVLVHDFNELLSAKTNGSKVNLEPVVPYSNYINWLRTIDKDSSLGYWKEYLADYTDLARIPSQATGGDTTYVAASERMEIGGDLFQEVDALCNRLGITHNTFIQGVWGYLLSCYNNTNDVVFGSVVSGRPADLSGIEDMIGLFINTVPVRVAYDQNDTPATLLQVLQDQSIQSTHHHYTNLSEVQAQSELGMELMDHILIFENYAVKELEQGGILSSQDEGGFVIEAMETFERTNYDFNVIVSPSDVSLGIALAYNLNGYDQQFIKNLIRHFDQLIHEFVEKPNQSLGALNYLSEEEKHELLVTNNDKAVAYPKDKTIVDLFEEQVAKTPDKTALVFEDTEISYHELNERSNQLAHYLKDTQGIKPDDLVGFQLARGENMIITILAILKAGAAYIPIEIDFPEEKVNYIANDSQCLLIIDENNLPSFIAKSSSYEKTNGPKGIGPDNLIYAIYTSGSTGLPKGVLVEHSSIVAHIFNVKKLYGVSEESRFLQFFNIAFDAAAQEIFTTLSFGATLYLKTPEVDPEYIIDLISTYEITHADFSTAFFNSLIATIDPDTISHKLEFCAIGGEKVEKRILEKQWRNISNFTSAFYNVYGPTETTLTATWFPIMVQGQLSNVDDVIPIGKSYAGRQVLILDTNLRLLPIGLPGEIFIGGIGVARGYLNREELTQEKFITNPFKAGERLYKTGDLGRRLPDGNIEFIGRKDDQVKIRGYRIELGEIEHALLNLEAIKDAIVLTKERETGEKELVAYITADEEQNISDLRVDLKKILPAYMLPAYYVQLDSVPLTANGKVDKKALPDPEGLGLESGEEYVAPITDQELALTAVWSDVLKRDRIGIKDNFYNLGGDSIKSIQVVARLKQKGYTLKVEQLLRNPVLEELAPLMEHTTQLTDQREVSGRVVLTPIQEWFFKAEEIKEPDHFNQSVLLDSKEALDGKILEQSLKELTRHHDALRMVYQQRGRSWEQMNQDTGSKNYTLDFHDLRATADGPAQITKIGEELQSSIKLSEGPLLRAVHFRLADGDRLGLIIHHLVVDGVSWRILLEDLSTLYTGYKQGKNPELPLKTDSFQRWALLQQEYAASEMLAKERPYWQEVIDQQIAGLPWDVEVKEGQTAKIDTAESFRLNQEITGLLQTKVHGVYNTEINDVLLTGLGLALQDVLGVERSVVKMEGHGREQIVDGVDISRTVGWFTTTYPYVLDISGASDQTDSLVNVKEALRRLPNKGIGYGMLAYLSEERLESKLTPEIAFNYLGDFGSNVSNDEGSLFEYAAEHLGLEISAENESDALLDVSGMLVKGSLNMSIRYSRFRYDESTIKKLAASYQKHLESLIEELTTSKETHLTPSDLSFKELSREELSRLNADNNLEDVYELSPLQEGIYYHWLAEGSGPLYLGQSSCRVRADALDIDQLKSAFHALINRHAVLRTSFSTEFGGRSLQIVRKEVPGNFTYEQLDKGADQHADLELIRERDRNRGFDLTNPSQMRLQVIELSKGEYEFIWSSYHILMDGWCMSVLINDFSQLLHAATTGQEVTLPRVLPYANYISWLREVDRNSSLNFWRDYLSDYSLLAEIPFKTNTEESAYVEAREYVEIEGDLFESVNTLCNQLGITLNSFIEGVWGYLLSRYNNTNDVVFGAVVSGRPADLPGVEDMIGLFINTVPVRITYDPDDTPVALLKSRQEKSIEGTSHHYTNLSDIQAQSELGKNLFDHAIVFENYAVKELENDSSSNNQKGEQFMIQSVEVFEQVNYDFSLAVQPTSTSITIMIKYNQNYYNASLIGRIKSHFNSVINKFTEHPNQALNI